MSSPSIPEPKPAAPMPVEDDSKARLARTKEATRQSASTGRESTILTGRLGDPGQSDYRGTSDVGGKSTLG